MIGILTGDIAASRKIAPAIWIAALKKELSHLGDTPGDWEIYRGDSFQAKVTDPLDALLAAFRVKARIKCIRQADVRIAIGIGNSNYQAAKITESNGTAFVHSGEKFERLKKEKQYMAIRSDWPELDAEINFYLKLGLIAMNTWSEKNAQAVIAALEHPALGQAALGVQLGIGQNAVSGRLNRAHFHELMEINDVYRKKLGELLSQKI